jgi:hypothetical protein
LSAPIPARQSTPAGSESPAPPEASPTQWMSSTSLSETSPITTPSVRSMRAFMGSEG